MGVPAPRREPLELGRQDLGGDATTGEPSSQWTSAITSAVPGCHGTDRNVDRSGSSAKSP